MRKMLLLAVTGLFFDFGVTAASADPLRDRDAAIQHEMAGEKPAHSPTPAGARSNAHQTDDSSSLAPGFVTPYGYPLPPYADGNNFQTIYTGR